MPQGCTVTPSDAKSTEDNDTFILEDSNGELIGNLQALSETYMREQTSEEETYESVKYTYVSKGGNVTCNNASVLGEDDITYNIAFNMNFKTGWNKEYKTVVINTTTKKGTMKSSLDPKALTKEVKWYLY
jgi:hypothetical protein